MKTSDNYIIMIRMLKVLWYYKRPKTKKLLNGRGGTEKEQQQDSGVIRGKW